MNDNKRLFIAITISALSSGIGYLIHLFLTPYITKTVGIEAYGFVSISRTFVNYASIITTALTVFAVRYIAVNYHKGEMNEAVGYYSSSIFACITLSVAIFILMIPVILYLDHLLNIPNNLISSVKLLFVMMFAAFALTTTTVPYRSSVYIKNRLDLSGIIKILSYVGEIITLVFLFYFFNPSIYYIGIGTFIAATIVLLSNIFLTKKLTQDLKYDKKQLSVAKIVVLTKNGVWTSINQLGNTLNSGLDLLIANIFLTGVEMGEIAVAKTLGSIFATLIAVIFQPTQPALIKKYSSGNNNDFINELTKDMRICGLGGAVMFSSFFSLGESYFKLWLPEEDYRLLHALTLLTVVNYITESVVQPLYYVTTLTVKNKVPCWVTLFGGFMNVLAMFLLLSYTNMGVYAVVITTAVIMISINLLFNPIYSSMCLKMSSKPFYSVIVRHVIACFVMTALLYMLGKMFCPQKWITLLLSAFACSALGVIIYIPFVCTFSEQRKIISIVHYSLRRFLRVG